MKRLTALLASALLLAAIAPVGDAAAPEQMEFGAYGDARVGDTPAEVRRKVPGLEPCHRLSGSCVCASVEVGERSVVFVYRLDRSSRVDLIFTSSSAVPGPRGIRVGDGVNRLKRLFPNAHPGPTIYGTRHFVVNKGRIGLLAAVRGGQITQLTTGRNRFFDYVEYCS
jgi:hypothetical protein